MKSSVKRRHFANGQVLDEEWLNADNLHREDGPAFRSWYENGQLQQEEWLLNGDPHRIDGPAYRFWTKDGCLKEERWEQRWWGENPKPDAWLQGLHRLDGPANRYWDLETGDLILEEWWVNGRRHRLDGPAVQEWDEGALLIAIEWWRDGKPYKPTAHDQILFLKRAPTLGQEERKVEQETGQ